MTAGRLDQHHVKSLERLVGKGSEGLLERPLRRLFPVKTKHGVVRIGKVDWKGPYWMGASERPQWVRTLEFHVSVNGSKTARGEAGHPEPKVWLSPLWPIDDSAAKASDWLTPGVRLGRASLIDGRPLVPLRQRAYKPGLHVLRNDNCAGRRRLVLVPDAGASLIINPTTMSKRGYRAAILGQFLLESGSRRPSATFGANPEEHSDNSKQFLVHFRRLVGHDRPPTAYFSVDTAKQVKASLGKYPEVSELDDYWDHLKRLCEDSNSELPDFEHELSDEVLVTRDYGDLLAEVMIESILAAVREFHELDRKAPILLERGDQDPDDAKAVELAKRINGQFYRRYRHMRSGGEHAGTRYPALVVGVDDRSTLADLEQRRKVTRYSAEIGTDTSHWTWTRGIHSRDRNQLCPLQTPESEDIGYVRFLALGEGNEYDDALGDMSDLSAAASLIPFVNHNDPARASIGSKNLKQALPIEGASRPCVRSGTETLIAEAHGVACMDNAGEATVTAVLEDRVVAEADGEEFCVLFGPPGPTGFWADGRWKTRVEVGDSVKQGDLVAHAPDVVIDDDGLPVLALGTDVLVAYTPWHGMNYEDAVVVSESIKEKFTSVHVLSISERCRSQAELPHAIVCKDDTVAKGDVLAWILSMNGERLRTVKAPEDGRVDLIDDQDPDGITIRLQARRPLAVGDKLTNRHGGKCIVSQILPASEMPELPDGRKVEMLLNPLGVIKRLNVGQLLETHVSLLDDLTPEAQLEPVGRQYGPKQRKELAEALREKGAPGGRLKLKCADGTVLDRHGGVVVGWQYMVKLDHLAIDKRTERRRIAANPRDRQPAKGRRWQGGQRRGGALRTGEMEIWALLALGADAFLNETLTERSRLSRHANATLDSVKAHLAVGQIGIDPDNGEVRLLDSRDTDRLPEEDAWLKVPSTYSYVPDQDSDVLYAEAVHGRSDEASTCSCGHESQDGYRCTECGDVAVPRESPECSQVRLRHVRLDSPVRHPWFGWSKQKEEEDRNYPFPEDEARNREERQEQALAAARAAGLEPALGLGLDDGSMVALCREKDGETVWVSTPDESRLLQLWGTRPTLLDDAKDLMIDGHRKRAFLLSPAMHEGQVTELDLNTGEFVRNWVANPYRDADLAELITLERGWPVLWGPEIGRCDCVPMLHAIPILPPAYRVFDHDWLDRRYRDLFHTITLMRNGRRDAGTLARVVRGLLGSRNDQPDAQTISGRLNSKMGLLRRGLRGRHNNSVARSVIAPDTSLGLEQVGLPKVTMDELGPEEGGLEEGKVVVVNRQPTLRPSNVIALSAYRHDGDHVALHPLMAKQLAGDFDGDEVTVHCPVSEEAADEAWERLRPTAALLSDANGEPIMKPDLDVALGLHLLSSFDDGHDQLKEFFRLCVPEVTAGEQAEQEEFFEPHVPEAMTGEQAEDLVQTWYRLMMDYNQPDRATKIHSMFELSIRACVGWSASLLELEQMDEGAFERMVDAVEDGPGIEAVGNEAAELPGWLFEAMRARAAGKLSGLKQLLVHRGEHRTLTGEVHSKINSCFLDGLSSADLFETAPAALEKLAQKKLVTPWAGVLTKRLADAMYEVIVTRADCGSPEENRTPLVCREKSGCCQACVGELVSGRTPDVNERLGLRAAMLIGERCTQGAMNTFHSGGTGDAVERAVKELEAAFGQRSRHPVKGYLSLEDAFDEDRLTFDKGRLTNIAHQVEEAANIDGKLASLVLRQLASLNIVDKPLQAAAISEDPLVDASTAGKLSVLLDAIQGDIHRADGLRATQVYHNLDAPDPHENSPLILDAEGQYGEAGTA